MAIVDRQALLRYRKTLTMLLVGLGQVLSPGTSDEMILDAVKQHFAPPKLLLGRDYVIEHRLGYPQPFLVRLNGGRLGNSPLDRLPPKQSLDAIGLGTTLKEATEAAIAAQDELKKNARVAK